MTAKQIKLLAGVTLLGGAFALGMAPSTTSTPKATKAVKGAKTPETIGLLAITHPEDEKNYAEGTYVFEGQIGKGKRVEVFFDDRDPVDMDADSDGAYRYEAPKVKEGDHKIEVKVSDKKDKDAKPESQELMFTVKKGAQKQIVTHKADSHKGEKDATKVAKNSDDELPTALLPEDDGSDVVYTKSDGGKNANPKRDTAKHDDPKHGSLGAEDIAKKDSVVAAEAHGKPAGKKPTPSKPAPGKANLGKAALKKPAGKFVISSHSNFNVVPHGVIKVGGKGTPGEKVMLLVDGKPSMRGTIKPDGRWSFPVKVSKAGYRKITAQNLKTRQQVWVKLKIK